MGKSNRGKWRRLLKAMQQEQQRRQREKILKAAREIGMAHDRWRGTKLGR